jgi:dihydrofolate reductase
MSLTLIAAVATNNVIGVKGKMPWHIPEDFRRFKRLTIGHPVIMGLNTYNSIVDALGHPLPDRHNIVLFPEERQSKIENVYFCKTIEESIEKARQFNPDAFIIGGQSVYQQTINLADKLEITEVHKNYDGDAFFPVIDKSVWNEINREPHGEYSFVTYLRIV